MNDIDVSFFYSIFGCIDAHFWIVQTICIDRFLTYLLACPLINSILSTPQFLCMEVMLIRCDIKIRCTRVECSHDSHALLKCIQVPVLRIDHVIDWFKNGSIRNSLTFDKINFFK